MSVHETTSSKSAAIALLAATMALAGCGGGSKGGGSGTPSTSTGNAVASLVKAGPAYARIRARHGNQAPGHGVRITVIDTGIETAHWEFDPSLTSEEVYESGAGDALGDTFSHGTAVASVIGARRSGERYPVGLSRSIRRNSLTGIAYGAKLHMVGILLASGGRPYTPVTLAQLDARDASNSALFQYATASTAVAGGNAHILNMSFGVHGPIERYSETELRANYDQTIATAAQAGTAEADRTLLVWAAGNYEGRACTPSTRLGGLCPSSTRKLSASSPGVYAGAMARIAELRSHSVAVVATDRNGQIADWSNRCGIAAKWCIAAPGEDVLAAYWGPDDPTSPFPDPGYWGYERVNGTSFAAPVVSGGLAVLMHYFRGQMGNHQVLDRLLTTADVTPDPVAAGGQCPAHLDTDGDRSACELSSKTGRGLMNLEAATRPAGGMAMGARGEGRALPSASSLRTPSAYGDLGARLGSREVAAFDQQGFPYWYRLGAFLDPAPAHTPILPEFAAERATDAGPTWSNLAWRRAPGTGAQGLSLSLAADGEGDLRTAGFAYAPERFGRALEAGLMLERGTMLGAKGQGAFESQDASHGLAFGTWHKSFALAEGVGLRLTTTWAGGSLAAPAGLLVEANGLYSQHRVALEHTGKGALSRLSIEQPLRAEAGHAVFEVPIGRDRYSGEWRYTRHRVGLAPDARALTFGLHHERDAMGGRVALGATHTVNAGHIEGREETTIGARYRKPF